MALEALLGVRGRWGSVIKSTRSRFARPSRGNYSHVQSRATRFVGFGPRRPLGPERRIDEIAVQVPVGGCGAFSGSIRFSPDRVAGHHGAGPRSGAVTSNLPADRPGGARLEQQGIPRTATDHTRPGGRLPRARRGAGRAIDRIRSLRARTSDAREYGDNARASHALDRRRDPTYRVSSALISWRSTPRTGRIDLAGLSISRARLGTIGQIELQSKCT